MTKPILDAATLRSLLDYDPATGLFTWRARKDAAWDARWAGQIAGSIRATGYRHIKIAHHSYRAAHVAWVHHYGVQPKGIVDHEDRVRSNDAITNLRDVTASLNQQNRAGVNGYTKIGARYRALITTNGVQRTLGYFSTPEAAQACYAAACEAQGSRNHLNMKDHTS